MPTYSFQCAKCGKTLQEILSFKEYEDGRVRSAGGAKGGGNMVERSSRDELQEAPGIGPSLAADLHGLGVHTVPALARRDPERLYLDLCRQRGTHMDPCVFYAFRCAVYYARTPRPRRELLQWWNWKDRRLPALPACWC